MIVIVLFYYYYPVASKELGGFGKVTGFSGYRFAYLLYKIMVLEDGLNKRFSRPFPILCLYGENDILKNANLCLLIVLNQVLKDGINIKSRTLKGFFPC